MEADMVTGGAIDRMRVRAGTGSCGRQTRHWERGSRGGVPPPEPLASPVRPEAAAPFAGGKKGSLPPARASYICETALSRVSAEEGAEGRYRSCRRCGSPTGPRRCQARCRGQPKSAQVGRVGHHGHVAVMEVEVVQVRRVMPWGPRSASLGGVPGQRARCLALAAAANAGPSPPGQSRADLGVKLGGRRFTSCQPHRTSRL